jgi:cysteinyl-tRNA synthetase
MRIYNTLSQQKEPFSTREQGKAGIYVCGPTTYDYSHIGHARCYVVYDVLVRFLRSTGIDVTFVRNVTDVDDKILNRAKERNESPLELSERFRQAYVEDMRRLGNIDPDVEPKVSEHIDDIVQLIQRLIDRDAAYAAGGDVYFHVPAFKEYGKLSHRNLDDMQAGASGRVDDAEHSLKKHPFDFALWKRAEGEDTAWDSPWGKGRPGWHIECSAMSTKYLGETFDLHGGGLDLVFPHHENEIAQSEAASGHQYVRTWMHNGFVQVNKEKMSKSLGNFFGVREVFKHVEPEAMRYALLTMHYRAPFNLEWANDESGQVQGFPQFEEAERRLEYIYTTRARLVSLPEARVVALDEPVPGEIGTYAQKVTTALDDDLNTPIALAHTAELLSAVNNLCDRAMAKKGKAPASWVAAASGAFACLSSVLGLGADEPALFLGRVRDRRARALGIDLTRVQQRIDDRDQARKDKDYALGDAIRDELAKLGVEVLDAPEGTTWKLQTN